MTNAPHDHAGAGAHGEHAVGHVAPLSALIGTGLALLVLTWLTVWVAGIDLGEANIFIALGIAALKATLVALFFMHLRWDRPFNGIVFVVSVVFVALFIAFALTDTAEYEPDIQWGDRKDVVQKLQETGGTPRID